jgi:HTH-type transcriptional regulator/antitoxin HigA
MGSKNDNFTPAVAIPPGETIRENTVYLGMNQIELATRLDITTKHLSNILNGNAPITYDTALKLETVIGPSAQFWMNLETSYQLDKARLQKNQEIEAEIQILKSIPYKVMSALGWVQQTSDRNERVLNCRGFYGVSNLSLIQTSFYSMLRQQKQRNETSNYSVIAWLRRAETEGMAIEVEKLDKRKLRSYIPAFRQLTMKEPSLFYPEIKKMCSDCGVALVLVESLPKTYICGATIWRNDKAILALSVRGKRADIFWFTFFHELAHILTHSKKEFHICYERDSAEAEADRIASNYLIPEEQYRSFVTQHPGMDKESIRSYAEQIGIAPCILVGRLLHDGLIDYKDYSDMRPSFEITRKE